MYENEYTNREEMIEELIKIRDTHVRPRDVLVSVGFARYGARINNYHAIHINSHQFTSIHINSHQFTSIHINSMINEILNFEETMVPKKKQYKGINHE